jgi:hypothetical protein
VVAARADAFEKVGLDLFIADPGGQSRGLTGAGSSATLSAVLE